MQSVQAMRKNSVSMFSLEEGVASRHYCVPILYLFIIVTHVHVPEVTGLLPQTNLGAHKFLLDLLNLVYALL